MVLEFSFLQERFSFAVPFADGAYVGVKYRFLADGAAQHEFSFVFVKPKLGEAVGAGDALTDLGFIGKLYLKFAYVAWKYHNR
jgi:hypothetical protein